MTVYIVVRDDAGGEIAARFIAYARVLAWLEQNAAHATATCHLYDRHPEQGGVFLKTLRCEHGNWS